MQVEPQVTIPLVYQLTDPADLSTYYVRAVIKDSLSGAVIDTVNLASQGAGRYLGQTRAPSDPTGSGKHIDVVISVYTDSGYSVYSQMYAREMHNYIVKKGAPNFGGGGGGGADIDYLKIRKLIEEVITEKISKISFPATDLSAVLEGVKNVSRGIAGIKIPEAEKLNIAPALDRLDLLQKKIESMNAEISGLITSIDFPETDLTPLQSMLEELKKATDDLPQLVESQKEPLLVSFEKLKKELLDLESARSNSTKAALAGLIGAPPVAEKPKSDSVKSPYTKYFPQS